MAAAVGAITASKAISKQPLNINSSLSIKPQKSFQEIMGQVSADKTQAAGKPDFHQDLVQMQKDVMSGKELSMRDLFRYQIKAGQFHLRVELLSKAAEGMLASVRKFQSGQ